MACDVYLVVVPAALQIKVTLEEFADLQLKPCKGCVYSSCLCAGEAKSFRWSVTAEKLGEHSRDSGVVELGRDGTEVGC